MGLIDDDVLEDAAARLRNLRLGSAGTSVSRPPPIVPVEPMITYQPAPPASDPLDAQLKAYMETPYVITGIPAKYANLTIATSNMKKVSLDFQDGSLLDEPGIMILRAGPSDVAALGRAIIPMISSSFSRQGAAALFTLAYNTFTPGGKYTEYLLDGIEELETAGDKTYSEFSERPFAANTQMTTIASTGNDLHDAAVYSYIAASMLRLFTKGPSNYVKAWSHIVRGFEKFYTNKLDIQLPDPSEKSLSRLANWLALEPRAKISLYRLLYISSGDARYPGFKRFLYDIHLSNTGMHLASMFVSLTERLNCAPRLLLHVIDVKEFERQVRCLLSLFSLLAASDENHRRSMWRFGRIFDETFMADIQTKKCTKLVYIFGEALKEEMPGTYQNVLQIVQLKDVSESMKKKCRMAALKMLSAIRDYTNKGPEGDMESKSQENADSKAEFRKSWNDGPNRKYRRRYPLSRSSHSPKGTVSDEKHSASRPAHDTTETVAHERAYVKDSDIDAAKVAAMKAAELVNRNLIGTGYMSTDQKKKLLWGNKNTTVEEPARQWNTATFGDQERQEKFNKLMGVKGDVKVDHKQDNPDSQKQQEQLQLDLEKQYTAGLRRRDGRTVGLGL